MKLWTKCRDLCHFSVRTLLVVLAILCMLLAYWRTAKDNALKDTAEYAHLQTNARFLFLNPNATTSDQDAMFTSRPTSAIPFVVRIRAEIGCRF